MKSSPKNSEFAPLLGALKEIQFWLESERPPQVLVAAPTVEEFKKQQLPPHCRVQRRKIHGPRVPVRGRRQLEHYRLSSANWPNDGLVESIYSAWYFVISGKADIRIADYAVHCQAGDIIFIPARIPKLDGTRPHYEKTTPDAHCDLFMLRSGAIQFDGVGTGICHSRGDKHTHPAEGEGCLVKHPLLSFLTTGLGEELQNRGNTKSTFHLLLGLVLLVQQEIEQGRGFSSWQFPSESPLSYQHDSIQHAVQYIQNHLDRSLSIDQMAHWVGLSRTAFIKLFREQTGETFNSHLTALRLQRAVDYLLHSNLPIERISSRVGLTSGQLRNLFQRKYQCSPREFRRSSKND